MTETPPPGGGRRFRVDAEALLLPWLLANVPGLSRNDAKNLLRHEAILVNGAVARRHDVALRAGDEVVLPGRGGAAAVARTKPPMPILHEDPHLIVVEKPSGLLTMASDSEREQTAQRLLGEFLRARDGQGARVLTVHRLDFETSGVLLFARDEATHHALQSRWDATHKSYLAVVDGVPGRPAGELVHWLREDTTGGLRVHVAAEGSPGAQRAVLRYETVRTGRGRALVRVDLDTGRKHQIRVQMAAEGCAVAGDPRYGNKRSAPRLALHATRLEFPHPATGQIIVVESPLPEALARLVPARGG